MAPGKGDEGGEHGPFGAHGVFGDLNDELLAALDETGEVFFVFCGFIEVGGVDLLLLKKAVSFAAEVDENSLKAWLYAGNHRLVDVALDALSGGVVIYHQFPAHVFKRV